MTTTTYDWTVSASVLYLNNLHTSGNQSQPAIAANAAGSTFFAGWTNPPGNDSLQSRLMTSTGNTPAGEFTLNSTEWNNQNDASAAGLMDGRYVASFTDYSTDPNGDIRVRLFNPDGSPVANDFIIAGGAAHDTDSDVARLPDGGFVVTWTRDFGNGDKDVRAQVLNADGSVRGSILTVNTNTALDTSHSSVIGLAGGGFVVAWEERPAAGGDSDIRFRRYDANGNALDGSFNAGVLVDSQGSINKDVQLAALPDGGFVVAYTDNGWNGGTDITLRIYNADGSARTTFLQANALANGGTVAGDQALPTLTVLSNGFIVVGWTNADKLVLQAYTPDGTPVGHNTDFLDDTIEGEIAGLANNKLAVARSSLFADDGGDNSMTAEVLELHRKITGDSSSEAIFGHGDSLMEIISGENGDDVLEGLGGVDHLFGGDGFDYAAYTLAASGVTAHLGNPGAANTGDALGDSYVSIEGLIGSKFDDNLIGDIQHNIMYGGDGNDQLTGAKGNDTLDGGAGDDTAVFSKSFDKYQLTEFGGGKVEVAGPDGIDTLTGIEHLQFADVTLDVVDDGNALFDALYYLSHNPDVFKAGVDPLFHFNTVGWHEGRDPNLRFDTSGYLALNKDVAAAGVNPLEHYHQSGWKEGRDPSAKFDTTLYLQHNPDVAAAGIDPLEHYLQFGIAEGRQAYTAIGQNIVGGFDAQHYLFYNPDVAAAGIDPLFHFNMVGWQEGRNPNAWFDSDGYLAHYTDVAAAGINPLWHYETIGWKEGRDASVAFDTTEYLAANPDVAAAGINPLDHFLLVGIYEGREAVAGMWS